MKSRLFLYLFIFLLLPHWVVALQPTVHTSFLSNDSLSGHHEIQPALDTELVQGRIMLLEATMDLNQTLLQGIQASLDSFNVKRKVNADDKNVQATIHNMQRNRDKVLLTPYLLHLQDSLKAEIKIEQQEKTGLETLLSAYLQKPGVMPNPVTVMKDTSGNVVVLKDTATSLLPIRDTSLVLKDSSGNVVVVKDTATSILLIRDTSLVLKDSSNASGIVQDTLTRFFVVKDTQMVKVALKDTVVPAAVVKNVLEASHSLKDTTQPVAVIKNDLVSKDTTIKMVVSTKDTSAHASLPDSSNKAFAADSGQSHHTVPVTFDSLHIRPVIEAVQVEAAASQPAKITHWETARALYGEDDSLTEPHLIHEVTDTQTLQNSKDSAGYVPSSRLANNEVEPAMSDSLRHLKAQLFWTKAMKSYNEKNNKGAAEYLKKAIDILPGYYDAWYYLGEVDARMGLYSKALNEFKTCKNIDSTKAGLFSRMGNILLRLRQKDEAGLNFKKALSIDSNYVQAMMGLATLYVDKKQYKTAIREYTRVLNVDRGYHVAYRSKAMAEYQLKRYEAAIDDFTRFLIFDQSDASVYYFRGLSKIGENQQMDGCADLAFSAKLGYGPALKSLPIHCN